MALLYAVYPKRDGWESTTDFPYAIEQDPILLTEDQMGRLQLTGQVFWLRINKDLSVWVADETREETETFLQYTNPDQMELPL